MLCFAQQGFDRASTATIAREAGVSQGTVFHHFGTKEGLFAAIVHTAIDSFKECVEQAEQSELPPPERIELLLRLLGEMTLATPQRADIIIRRFFSTPDPVKIEDFGLNEVITAVRGMLEQGKHSGAFMDIDTQTATLSLLGIYLANYVGWAALGKSYDFVHALGRACRDFLEGIVQR
jgi:AcrR family transcriptional regulator